MVLTPKHGGHRQRTGKPRAVTMVVLASPDRRVEWLLRFATADLGRLSPPQLASLREALGDLTRGPRSQATQQVIEAAQYELRAFLTALAHRNFYELPVQGALVFYPAEDPKAQQRATKARNRGPRLQLLQELHGGSLDAALLQSAADLLRRVGLARLRACPYRPDPAGPPCDRLFLADRRQLFCIVEHSKADAQQQAALRRLAKRKKSKPYTKGGA